MMGRLYPARALAAASATRHMMCAMEQLSDQLAALFQRGGWVMLPLVVLSVISVALVVERAWFWLVHHRPGRLRHLQGVTEALRRGDRSTAARLSSRDHTAYGDVIRQLLDQGASEAIAIESVETVRPSFDRFMILLSTIITAAPMLGILGTVIGIIKSFQLLGDQAALSDPRAVSIGIAEALITTAAGLVVALLTLFPYMVFRGQADRAIGRLESIIAAAQEGERAAAGAAAASKSTGERPVAGKIG
jgi:biopolymer transport protein ExbB